MYPSQACHPSCPGPTASSALFHIPHVVGGSSDALAPRFTEGWLALGPGRCWSHNGGRQWASGATYIATRAIYRERFRRKNTRGPTLCCRLQCCLSSIWREPLQWPTCLLSLPGLRNIRDMTLMKEHLQVLHWFSPGLTKCLSASCE